MGPEARSEQDDRAGAGRVVRWCWDRIRHWWEVLGGRRSRWSWVGYLVMICEYLYQFGLRSPGARGSSFQLVLLVMIGLLSVMAGRSFATHVRSERVEWEWARWKESEWGTDELVRARPLAPFAVRSKFPPGEMHFVFATLGLGLLPPLRALALPLGHRRYRKMAKLYGALFLALAAGAFVVTRTLDGDSLASPAVSLFHRGSLILALLGVPAVILSAVFEVGLLLLPLLGWRRLVFRVYCRLLPRISVRAVRLPKAASNGMVLQCVLGWIAPANLLILAVSDNPCPYGLRRVLSGGAAPMMWVWPMAAAFVFVLISAAMTAFVVRRNVRIIARLTARS